MSQTSSRYIELLQLMAYLNVELDLALNNELLIIGSEIIKNQTSFQEVYEKHRANWQSRQDNLTRLSFL